MMYKSEGGVLFVSETEIKYVIDSLYRVGRKTGQSHWHYKMRSLSHLKNQSIGMPYFWLLKIYPSFSLSPYPRMLRAAWHGRWHNLQPADNSLIYPPCALWLAKVVPVLCSPKQEGPGQCLDRCRKWQMAVDSGKAPSQYREHAKPGQGQEQMDQSTGHTAFSTKGASFCCLHVFKFDLCLLRIPSMSHTSRTMFYQVYHRTWALIQRNRRSNRWQ